MCMYACIYIIYIYMWVCVNLEAKLLLSTIYLLSRRKSGNYDHILLYIA